MLLRDPPQNPFSTASTHCGSRAANPVVAHNASLLLKRGQRRNRRVVIRQPGNFSPNIGSPLFDSDCVTSS